MFRTEIDYFNSENGILVLKDVLLPDAEVYDGFSTECDFFDGFICNLIDSSRITYHYYYDSSLSKYLGLCIDYISDDDKNLVLNALSLPTFQGRIVGTARAKKNAIDMALCYNPEYAFEILRESLFGCDMISKDFHEFLFHIYNGTMDKFIFNDSIDESGFQNKNFVRRRFATDEEISYLNYVTANFLDEKDFLFGIQKVK
jgi:hypothetical protein